MSGLRRKTSRYRGVYYSSRVQAWFAQFGRRHAGRWETERAAAEAHDRAARYYEGAEAHLNFPRRALPAASIEALRAESRRTFKSGTTSAYRGVRRCGRVWAAEIWRDSKKHSLGYWRTEQAAAEAYDRAARFLAGGDRLNFPGRRLAALAPAQIRGLARGIRKAEATSTYLGVVHWNADAARPWKPQIFVRGRRPFLGTWESEKDAARAYDRAVRFYGLRDQLNFPHEDLRPADAATLAAEARREKKKRMTSRYLGVCWFKPTGRWAASITHRGHKIHLGFFDVESEAAEAYDAKSIELRGTDGRVNFDPVTGRPVWGKRVNELTRLSKDASRVRRRREPGS